jgi:hypothetical protein
MYQSNIIGKDLLCDSLRKSVLKESLFISLFFHDCDKHPIIILGF